MPGSHRKRSSEAKNSSKPKKSKSHKKKRQGVDAVPVAAELGAEFLQPSAFGAENGDSAISFDSDVRGVHPYPMDDGGSIHGRSELDIDREHHSSATDQQREHSYQPFHLTMDDHMMEDPYFVPGRTQDYSSAAAPPIVAQGSTTTAASSTVSSAPIRPGGISAEGRAKRRDKNRSGTACRPCEIGKRKCDGGRPCDRCVRIGKKDVCIDGKAATKKKSKGFVPKRKEKRKSTGENDTIQYPYSYHPPVSEYGPANPPPQEAYMDNLPVSLQQSLQEGQTPPLSVGFAEHLDTLTAPPGGHNDFRQLGGDPRAYMAMNSKF